MCGARVEDAHTFIVQAAAKVLVQQFIAAFYHKAHDLLRSIDNAVAIGLFGVVRLKKAFVDDNQDALLVLWQ